MKKKVIRLKDHGQKGASFASSIPLVGFLLFGVIPLLVSLGLSFTNLVGRNYDEMKFVGFDNFINIITNFDKMTWGSYFTTLVYVLNVPTGLAIALWIAYLINKSKIGKTFFRSVFFIPYVCSTVVVTLIFRNMLYHPEVGILNVILGWMGYEPVKWLVSDPWLFMLSAIIMTVWQGLGWAIVLFQAALANVDQSYYEAAKLDGATDAQAFWRITWPAITPTTSYIFTLRLIGAFQAMESLYLLVQPGMVAPEWAFGNSWASDTVVKQIFNYIWYGPKYGMASAAGWVLAIIILIITRINLRTQKRWVNYDF